ncbi:MAG: hypothetical protein ACNA8K_14175 [Cyclonatronaceae bacterium]
MSEEFNLGIIDMTRLNRSRLPDFHSLYLRMDRRYFLERRKINPVRRNLEFLQP